MARRWIAIPTLCAALVVAPAVSAQPRAGSPPDAGQYMPITGITNGGNATAGQVGEVQSSQVLAASAITLTTGTAANVTSVALTAGDWQCSSVVDFALAGVTLSGFEGGLSMTSASLGSQDTYVSLPMAATLLTYTVTQPTPRLRINTSTPVTVYLVAQTTFTIGTRPRPTARCCAGGCAEPTPSVRLGRPLAFFWSPAA